MARPTLVYCGTCRFFKPAAAFEKRITQANGTAENLPTQTRDDPEQQKRHSMELLQNAPMNMGLGIKREAPRHYKEAGGKACGNANKEPD